MMQVDKITQVSLDKFDAMIGKVQERTPVETKLIIAREIAEDEGIKQLLRLIYDPHIKYHYRISHDTYTVYPEDVVGSSGDVDKLLDILIRLSTEGKTMKRKEKESMVWGYIEKYSPHIVYFMQGSIDSGFGVSSAKSLGIISAHSPQKGVLLKSMKKLVYPVIADFKYNGIRLTTVIDKNGAIEFRLLRGQVIQIPTLAMQLQSLGMVDVVFDGELVYANRSDKLGIVGGITETDRIEVSGRITSATSMSQPLPMYDLRYVMYDIFDRADRMDKAERVIQPYVERRERLYTLRDLPTWNEHLVSVGSAWLVNNETDLLTLAKMVKDIGGEGLMIKGLHSTYDHKKNNQWYKLKNIQEADLRIVDYRVHSRNSNWIGSLLCKGTIDGKSVSVWVGSGLNDSDRPIEMYPIYKNKIAMVTYMDIVKGSDGYSLSNPRFVKDRADRSLVSVLRIDGNSVNF